MIGELEYVRIISGAYNKQTNGRRFGFAEKHYTLSHKRLIAVAYLLLPCVINDCVAGHLANMTPTNKIEAPDCRVIPVTAAIQEHRSS